MDRLAAIRHAFAEELADKLGLAARGEPVFEALARVPREKFLGPGPWQVHDLEGYTSQLTDDPALLYQDTTIALDAGRYINNGQPLLHAVNLLALALEPGETALHIGAGTGYYTAIMAELVGPAGAVHAYEIEPELAARAQANLAEYANVTVHSRSGTVAPLPPCDAVYVNAGCTSPRDVWLDAIRAGGRLLFPLAGSGPGGGPGGGAMLLITNDQGQRDAFTARFICGAAFIACTGAYDQAEAWRLAEAYDAGIPPEVCSLRRGTPPDESCWFAGDGWWLSTRLADEVISGQR